MEFPWIDLVDRVRFYADDDHQEGPNEGWVGNDKYMGFLQLEYREQYRKWLRDGLISVDPIDAEFVGSTAKVYATLPTLPLHPGYDGVIRAKANGKLGNTILMRFDDSGTGTGTLVEEAAGVNPAYLRGDAVFRFEAGVTTWQDFEEALTDSILFDLITPASIAGVFTAEDSVISAGGADYVPRVLALIGVAELQSDGCYRPLAPDTIYGRKPWRNTTLEGCSFEYHCSGAGDALTITLYPRDESGTYVVRYIQVPLAVTDTSATVELPHIADERLVLGALQRAGIKETVRTGLVSEAILRADYELTRESASRNKEEGMLIRRVSRSTPGELSGDPALWRYFTR
jgi:hypothetical protein